MTSVSTAYSVGVPRQLIQFAYDYLGRRIRKTVSNWNGSAYVAAVDRKFIYNGWNLIGEYDVASPLTLVSTYVWGLDLSGNLVDGGGVGGLLAIKQVSGSTWHLPYYDANGNLHALINRATGAVTAAYEYSPFGETLRANGSYAAANPFRFSTKYADTETGLLYYGYRYYSPSMGRFLGRDPLGESGGIHLYAFCGNNPVNRWDVLGMDPQQLPSDWMGWAGYYFEGDPDASWTYVTGTWGVYLDLANRARHIHYVESVDSNDDGGEPLSYEVGGGPGSSIAFQDPNSDDTSIPSGFAEYHEATLGWVDTAVQQMTILNSEFSTVPAGNVTITNLTVVPEPTSTDAGAPAGVTMGTIETIDDPTIDAGSNIAGTSDPNSNSGNATAVAGGVTGAAGLVAGAVENVQNGSMGFWLGKNGQAYSTSWGGNGATGGRLQFAGEMAGVAKTAGNVVGALGIGISALEGYDAFQKNDGNKMFQASADITVGVAGFFGPVGWAGSGGYFVGQMVDRVFGTTDAINSLYIEFSNQGSPRGKGP